MRLIALAAIMVAIVDGCSTAPFRCPVTLGVPPPEVDQSFAKVQGTAFGNGPVFAVVYGVTSDRIPFPTPWPEGVYAQKVPWMSRPSYAGDVSVSGRRLDAAGETLFGMGGTARYGGFALEGPRHQRQL